MGEPQKARSLTYVANDASIGQAKQDFANFLNIYLAILLPPGFPDANACLDSEIWRCLVHQAHHLGIGN